MLGAVSDEMQAVRDELAKGTVRPVYVLGGNEWLLVSRCFRAVREAVVGTGPRGLAEDVFDGHGASLHAVLDACRTLPMMAKRKLVVVRNAEDLLGRLEARDQRDYQAYLDAPEPRSVLLLVLTKFDARRTFVMDAKKRSILVPCSVPGDDAAADLWVERWLQSELHARRIEVEPGVVERLVAWVGPELGVLDDALERLSLYASGGRVGLDAVEALVAPVRELGGFDLSDTVVQRDLRGSLTVIAKLRAQRVEGLMILGSVGYSLRMLARAKQLLAVQPDANVSKAIYMHNKPQGWLAGAARRWTAPQIHRALRLLAATDLALKGSKGSAMGDRSAGQYRVLEEFVLALEGAPGLGELAE